jgi:hypothetical protein
VFMGHYAAALERTAFKQRAPLWSYVAAPEVLDIVWSGTIIAGVERVRFDQTLPGAS